MQESLEKFKYKCTIHPEFKLKYIQVDNFQENQKQKPLFYCSDCVVYDKQFKLSNYLKIQNILQSTKDQIISNWPPGNDNQILKQLIDISTGNEDIKSIESEIDQYFTDLKLEILQQLTICQEKMVRKAKELPNNKINMINKYQALSKVNELRSILEDDNTDCKLKEKKCKVLVEDILAQKKIISEQLTSLLEQNLNQQTIFNSQLAEQIKYTIFECIGNINLFEQANIVQVSRNEVRESRNEMREGNNIDIEQQDEQSSSLSVDYYISETDSNSETSHEEINNSLIIWKEIKNYPNYMVSNKGQVKNKTSRYIFKGTLQKNDQQIVHLRNKEGLKSCQLNQLVAQHFNDTFQN